MGSGTRYRKRKAEAERWRKFWQEVADEKEKERIETISKKILWVKGKPEGHPNPPHLPDTLS